MDERTKIFGIGMSKTGTTTLGYCFEILGFTPRASFEPKLKKRLSQSNGVEDALRFAERYRSFEDSPWYLLYKELDHRFPGSKFLLTVRKDPLTYAKSSWEHGKRRGTRVGQSYDVYIAEKVREYERHNKSVIEYFGDRPNDLLVLCWEKGDGWERLCEFLGVPVPPGIQIPHANMGGQPARLVRLFSESRLYNAFVRVAFGVSRLSAVHRLRGVVRGLGRSKEP